MISSPLGFYAFIFICMALVFHYCDKYKDTKLVKAVPGIIWIFLLMAFCATFGVFDIKSEGVKTAQGFMYSTFLPMMLIMFMLTCDVRKIAKLGPRMIFAFFCATFSIMVAFTVAFMLTKSHLPGNAWASVAATTGSFIGETINMVAVAAVFGVEGVDFTYSIMMVTFAFTIFLTVIMALIPHKDAWNRRMKASTDELDKIARRIDADNEEMDKSPCTFIDYMKLFAIALAGTWCINALIIPNIPPVTFLNATGWRVVLSSILGLILGVTPIRRFKGAQQVAGVFLYLSLCVTASYSDLAQCTAAPMFLVLCLIFLVVVFALMYLFSKLFRFDLFTAEVALTANVGGTASAPLIAAAHNPNWISFGILLAFLGDVVGTWIAISFGYFLKYLAGA